MIVTLDNCLVPECVKTGDTSHKWEFERFTVQELLKVQEVLGLEPDEFDEALNEKGMSGRMIRAAIMLAVIFHKRIGTVVAFDECDFDIVDLEFLADPTPDEPEGKEPATTSPLPEVDDPTSSTSGPSPAVASEPSSSATAATSGGGTGSP